MGETLAYLSAPKSFRGKPILAEVWVLKQMAEFCDELGFRNVLLEGDAQEVVNAIRSKEVNYSWYGEVIEDLKVDFRE